MSSNTGLNSKAAADGIEEASSVARDTRCSSSRKREEEKEEGVDAMRESVFLILWLLVVE